LAGLVVFVVRINIETIPPRVHLIPDKIRFVGEVTRLDQSWDMFAPYPLLEDGWYSIPATLKDRTEVDLFRDGAPVSPDKPADVAALYANQRWQKYMMNLWSREDAAYRLPYAQYLCRTWNSTHTKDKQIETLQIIFMLERTLPNYQTPHVVPVTLFKYTCL
jgi:hypothetical protein